MRKRILTIAAYVGLHLFGLSGIDSAQAQFTYNLNNQTFSGFNFVQPNTVGFTGTLTSVSVNVTLNASVAYTYADDICIYVDIAPLSTGGLLQVGGFSNLSAAQRYFWPNGGSEVPGTTCIGTVTLTTPLVFTGTASDPVLWIGNGYGAAGTSGTWTGSITLNNLTPVTAGPTCTAPTLSATTVAAVCQGSADGSVDLTITGGSPTPLSILWSNGANTEDLSNVAAGTYTVTVTTADGGCTATGSYTVADGATPTLWYADADGDGYGAGAGTSSCSAISGSVTTDGDCNDSDNSVNPGVASDDCNGVDNDCDGSTDEDATFSNYYVDADGDGYGAGAATSSCSAISGSVTTDGDCNDSDNAVNPGVASDGCNGVDNDCDGSTDEDATFSNYYVDADGDGYGAGAATSSCSAISGSVTTDVDCNDGDNSVNPGAASDSCNGVDNDCDGSTDEDATFSNYYADADGDGYGAGAGTSSCSAISGSVTVDGDCDDLSTSVNPGTTEVCNSIDDNCNGAVDEGTSPSAVSITGNSTGCLAVASGSATFSVSPAVNAVTYTWTLPAGMTLVSGQGTSQISVSWTLSSIENGIIGSISVTPSSGCGSAATTSIPVDLNYTEPVRPSSISGASKLCPGDVFTYSVAPVARATGYVWSLPAGMSIVSGAGTNVIGVSVGAGYTGGNVECRGSNVCGSGVGRTRAVNMNLLGSPGNVTGATTGICLAGGVNYSVAAVTGATGYDWTVPAGVTLVSGQGTSMISVNYGAGFTSGSITVAAVNGCGSGAARSVTVSGSPDRPGFITGDVTICPGQTGVTYGVPTVTGSSNYLWTVPNGTSIVAGLGSKDIVTNWGTTPSSSLTVAVRASNACGNSISRGLNTISIGSINCGSPRLGAESSGDEMTLFPNPATENFELTFSSTEEQPYRLMILDATGKVVHSESGMAHNGPNKVMVNISDLLSGMYLVSCEVSGQRRIARLIK